MTAIVFPALASPGKKRVRESVRVDQVLVADSTTGNLYRTTTTSGSRSGSRIEFQRSADGGATWTAKVAVAAFPVAHGSDPPAIAVDRTTGRDRGRVHLAWTESLDTLGTRDVFASHSDDGASWSAPVKVNDTPAASQAEITVADDGMPYATWSVRRDGAQGASLERYLSRSTDGGATWVASQRLPEGRTRFDDAFSLTTCQGDLAVDPGSTLNPGWTVHNLSPLFANAYGWTLSSQRNWRILAVGAASAAVNGMSTISPTLAVPDSAAPGVNRMCLTVSDARGVRSRTCCFDLTVQKEPPDVPVLASAFDLQASVSDPANQTRIDFSLPYAGAVRLQIHGVRGELVRTLADGMRPEGPNTVTWDGRDERGGRAGAGAYFCRLEGFGNVRVQRLIWLR